MGVSELKGVFYHVSPAIWGWNMQCYLPTDTGERAHLDPSQTSRYLIYRPPEGMQG